MKSALSQNAIDIVSQSSSIMEHHRGPLGIALCRYMERRGSDGPSDLKDASWAILEMLFDHARGLAGARPLQGIDETARQHRRLAVRAEHYSSFGDGLAVVMKDVLRARASPAVLWAWGDIYWAIARAVLQRDVSLAA